MWYVLQTRTGGEENVRAALRSAGFPALAPMEHRTIHKGGGWTLKDYSLFPGYVFVNLDYNAENYYRVMALPGVLRFLCTGGSPSPLTYLEAEWITSLRGPEDSPLEPTKVRLREDGSVEILSGILRQFTGRAIRYDKRSRRATVELTVCGQPKQVTLSIEPVEDMHPEEQGG